MPILRDKSDLIVVVNLLSQKQKMACAYFFEFTKTMK